MQLNNLLVIATALLGGVTRLGLLDDRHNGVSGIMGRMRVLVELMRSSVALARGCDELHFLRVLGEPAVGESIELSAPVELDRSWA